MLHVRHAERSEGLDEVSERRRPLRSNHVRTVRVAPSGTEPVNDAPPSRQQTSDSSCRPRHVAHCIFFASLKTIAYYLRKAATTGTVSVSVPRSGSSPGMASILEASFATCSGRRKSISCSNKRVVVPAVDIRISSMVYSTGSPSAFAPAAIPSSVCGVVRRGPLPAQLRRAGSRGTARPHFRSRVVPREGAADPDMDRVKMAAPPPSRSFGRLRARSLEARLDCGGLEGEGMIG
jgi:hypothetical protein